MWERQLRALAERVVWERKPQSEFIRCREDEKERVVALAWEVANDFDVEPGKDAGAPGGVTVIYSPGHSGTML